MLSQLIISITQSLLLTPTRSYSLGQAPTQCTTIASSLAFSLVFALFEL